MHPGDLHASVKLMLAAALFAFLANGRAAEPCDGAPWSDDALMIGVSGFSEAVCNEKGVREVKEFGADFVRCVKIYNRETLDLLAKYGVKAVVKGVVPSWWGGKTELAGLMHEQRPLSAYAKAK